MIKYLSLRSHYDALRPELDAAYSRVMQSGVYVGGPEVAAFEDEWAKYCGTTHCVAVGSGMAALQLALESVAGGEKSRSIAIVPTHTHISTWLAVTHAGMMLQPVEPTSGYVVGKIDKLHVDGMTKVILPVHMYGFPALMDEVCEMADNHGLYVISDGAQAHGAKYNGRNVAQFGDATCWSFYPTKNLGGFGEGGAITTDSHDIAKRARALRDVGRIHRFNHYYLGHNFRMDPLQAAFLRVKLEYLDNWNARRARLAQRYIELMSDIEFIELPKINPCSDPVWHVFPILSERRDDLRAYLRRQGVDTSMHYPVACHHSAAYRNAWKSDEFPVAERFSEQELSLPLHPFMGLAEVEKIAYEIRRFE